MELDVRHYLTTAKEQQDSGALQSAYSLLLKSNREAGTCGLIPRISLDLYTVCAEVALQLGCLEISAACLKMFFEGNPPANQFLCRAYLCQGQLKSPPATGTVEDFEEAVLNFLKAIEIAKSEPGCYFIVFNASVLYLQTVRPLLQPGRCHHLVSSLRQVVQSLDEVADQDHSWRAELMMQVTPQHLIKCLVGSGNTEEARSFTKVTEEFIKSNSPHLYPRLFTLQVLHNLTESDVLIEKSQQCSTLAAIYKIQHLKNKLEERNEDKPAREELEQIYHLLENTKSSVDSNSPQSLTPIQTADRVAFLMELALLALQLKHQKVAADCLEELNSAGEASNGQRIIMECVKCEINVLKKEAKMDDYSKASVEARLKEIGKLDQWLRTAVREGEPQAMQVVCATQWSLCLPLLQPNLRKHIKKALLRVSQVLEDTQSMMLEMRCQVHSELAVIEEEEGRLQAALTHLQKASLLDNGTQRERLSSALHLLHLRGILDQTPPRSEDKAAMLMQQAKDLQPQDKTDIRPVLVAVGLLLAPDDFQMVLDADNTSKIPDGNPGSGPAAQLSAKAQHHSASIQKVGGYLAREGDDVDNIERMKLWATLVQTARKQEVWDVCRAACRFCLLYDDGRWKISKTDKCCCSGEESCTECPHRGAGDQRNRRDLLRLLAEIHFISAEATIQKLQTEGEKLNSPPVPAEDREECMSEADEDWVVYRNWIQTLSTDATSSFLRGAELGAEIREPWVITNAAIYLWNHSSHLLAAGEYKRLLPTFQTLVEMLQETECTGSRALLVLLCDAVAQGLIQPLYGPGSVESAPPAEKSSKKRVEKRMEKASSAQGGYLDPGALQEVHKALELCEYALRLSNGNNSGEMVPMAVRKQVVSTWVQIKRLLQQQIGSNIDTKDECENEEVSAMTRVLVGVEMFLCNRNPRHMEFSVPTLSTLVGMASDSSWTDAVVELQVWCQLASFCHSAEHHDLVLCCTEKALQLGEAAEKSLDTQPFVLYGLTAVNEMLSSAACLRGLSLVHESRGDLLSYREALSVLLSSVSFAEKAVNPALCAAAARHYWNACLPLTQTPEERQKLQQPLERILTALIQTNKKHASVWTLLHVHSNLHRFLDEEDLTLRAAIYSLLFHIQADKADWKSALRLLDQAIKDMPTKTHQLPLLEQRILVIVRLGGNIQFDMKRLEGEGEQCCSFMWHQVALCSGSVTQQLSCYQKSISCLKSPETWWQKVNLLLEFGEWLFCHNFPKGDAQQHVQWAVDILLQREREDEAEDDAKMKGPSSVQCESPVRVRGSLYAKSLSDLKEVRRLDSLVRAHTLLAVMADRTAPEHQLYLLRAYTFVLQIWKVSMAVCCEISSETAKTQPSQSPLSAGSKKGKGKSKSKNVKDPSPAEKRPQPVVLDQELPSTPIDWAGFICPEQARQIFRTTENPQCINTHSITKQTQSLFYLNLLEKELNSLSLQHLTLPIMHLAETIAHDLLEKRSLSDLYQLRIIRTCCQLGLKAHTPYYQQLQDLSRIQEQEQMDCRKEIAFLQERRGLDKDYNQNNTEIERSTFGLQSVNAQDVWLDKAEVCVSMELFQQARQLIAEAHMVASELGDVRATARSLLSLAVVSCKEQNFAQALSQLEKAKDLGGDEEFWYQFTLTKVRAAVGLRDQDAHNKVDTIIKQGCDALKLVLEQQVNRVQEITFLITSLKMRGAVECTRALCAGKPVDTLCKEAVQRISAACDTFRECVTVFTKLGYRQHAAEAHEEASDCLGILTCHTFSLEDRQRFLLDSVSELQLAVADQEHVVLNAQRLFPLQEESSRMSLAASRKLQQLRLDLAEYSLVLLEVPCEEERYRALAMEKMTSADKILEEYTRCSPEPDSVEQEWSDVASTLGQVALGQLAAVWFQSPDNVEAQACCLSLKVQYLRLMALQEDPLYLCALWDRHKQTGSWSDTEAVSVEKENSEEGKDRDSGRSKLRMTQTKNAELQRRRCRAQQLLAEAVKVLSEAISLCLQHNLPSSILADASLHMLECHGQSDSAMAGQYLALYQSCCTAATVADVLSSACSGTSESELSALLLSQEERPSIVLREVDSLNSISKAFSQLTINPNHLNILAELPPNLKILLLQHSEDGSELYGAFYEATETSNQKGKTTQCTGTLACSRVAKVSVCPRALLALRKRTRAFGQDSSLLSFKEACWQTQHATEGRKEVSEKHQVSLCNASLEEELTPHFKEIVQDMENYLKPLLTQLDFRFRPEAASPNPETAKSKDKEAIEGAEEPGQYVVLLADKQLLELPLEALSILQEDSLASVSRDFSLQVLHSRLNREEPLKVESDNNKKTKGGKGMKAKADQSQAIKAAPVNHTLPSHTLPVDIRNFKYIVDLHSDGSFDGASLSMRMEDILKPHSQHLTSLWEGVMGNQQAPSLLEMQQLLSRCSAFIYLGMECFMANIPPGKLAALNLSECRMALLFDLARSKASVSGQTELAMHKSSEQLALGEPLQTALLLSLGGVGCIALNQWHSTVQQNTHNAARVLDNLLRVKLTSGQSVHSLRKGEGSATCQDVTGSHEEVLLADSEGDAVHHKTSLPPSAFNFILYGLPNLMVI
ncbi:LOW QUALITY PROTEIN: cilia- and flagella-associated protein 46 [Xyrichtys novacula]|uniref:LOW QUALITY PROTEIN: cilia- and flagella-associated protein 46 n=1 Tax=Xyrichtys novacula TaxID=13765 RepID=A0AAV1G0R2_XYRNO|nr:LOW QUALITY PROTEIN: cilia- and flagella-associated protein 46 [Xyrichtys novacula]